MTSHDWLEAVKYMCICIGVVGGLWALGRTK